MARRTLKLLKLEPPFVLALDRTEWQFGKSRINVLMLSVSYKKISLPLFWTVGEKKGCSDKAERRAIWQQSIDEFGAVSIDFVTADREFASKQSLRYLVEQKINFRLRIKANAQITDKRGKAIRASKLWRTLKVGARMECRRRRKLWNTAVFVAVCRKRDGDAVIVISSQRSGQILLEYGKRWQIETLFGCLKTRGFTLEGTHLTDAARVGRLLSLLTLAGCRALLAGEFTVQETPIKIKKHARSGEDRFPFGIRYTTNLFLPDSDKIRTKAKISTTYTAFVPYLVETYD